MSLDFVEAIPSKDRLTQSCCPFHRERLAEGCRHESETVQALPTRSTTQLRIQSPVSSDTPPRFHTRHIKQSIIYSQFLRCRRICSKVEIFLNDVTKLLK